jgi:hypothetical protein
MLTRHFFYRAERTRTTWKFRVGSVVLLVLTVWLTRPWWTVAIAGSLVCDSSVLASGAIFVENFDADYLLFERARRMRQSGVSDRVLVPVAVTDGEGVNAVALGITELMAKLSRVGEIEVVPIREVEPISLNAARDVLGFLKLQGIRSVVVVTPMFRSRRSALVYEAVLGPAGIGVTCEPVEGARGVDQWDDTWHGIQNVAEQWLKLQYYRLWVMPFRFNWPADYDAGSHPPPPRPWG